MFKVKTIVAGLFLSWHSGVMLMAQNSYKQEITCNCFCGTDSLLFYQEVKPADHFIENAGETTNLHGPYFGHFPGLKSDMLSALCFYPELSAVNIKFSYKAIKQTMNSRPTFLNIFRQKANRQYRIIINNNQGRCKGLPFEELTFNIKIGWLGHELAHICSYEKMNNRQTFWFAVKYVFSKKYVRKVERYTDLKTIEHGLAYPLYAGTDYLLRSKDIGTKYRNYAIKNGLTLSEIKCFWCNLYHKTNPDPSKNHFGRR